MGMNRPAVADVAMDQVAPISRQSWDAKYWLKDAQGAPVDVTIENTWRRVARALAQPETDPAHWEARFYEALKDFRFLPATQSEPLCPKCSQPGLAKESDRLSRTHGGWSKCS